MAILKADKQLENKFLARKIKNWFTLKNFETKALFKDDTYLIKAKKSSGLRTFVGADRAIEVLINIQEGKTSVEVRQGSWKKNIVSNAAWLVVTGGMNLAISGWSVVIQKDLENFIREILENETELEEIDL